MSPKKFFILLALFIPTFTVGAVFASYLLDPFQIYHTSFYSNDRYLDNDRYQNAGLINKLLYAGECCDTVILGTSHSQNFLPVHIKKSFGVRGVLDLTMSGAHATEQEVLFKRIKDSPSIEKIIWGIHTTYSDSELYEVNEKSFISRAPDKYFPLFLYDKTLQNDIKYLASVDSFLNAYRLYTSGKKYNVLKSWYNEDLSSFNIGQSLANKHPELIYKNSPEFNGEKNFPNIDEVLVPIVRGNKHINFMFFIPPYSKHYYANIQQEDFTLLMNMRSYITQKLSQYENVELYEFDNSFDSTLSLDNYKDLAHYNEDTSKRIIEFMSQNKGNLNSLNIEESINSLVKSVNLYIEELEKGSPSGF